MARPKTKNDQDVRHRLMAYPYHVKFSLAKSNVFMLDWLLEKGPPTTEWTVMGLQETWIDMNGSYKQEQVDWYCFKSKRAALLFKILWEHRSQPSMRGVKWTAEEGGCHLS